MIGNEYPHERYQAQHTGTDASGQSRLSPQTVKCAKQIFEAN